MLLPLTTFEQSLLWDDRPAYPWNIFVRLHFSGRLDRMSLESAVRTVLKRHPLLASKVEQTGRNQFHWLPVDDAQPAITWLEQPIGGPFPQTTGLNLREEIGLKIQVVADEVSSELVLQFHHVCCDGAGMFSFVDDLLVAYAIEQGEKSKRVRLAQLEPNRLAKRGKYGLTPWKLLKMAPKQMVGLCGAGQFLMRSPVPLLPYQAAPNDSPVPPEYPATVSHSFEVAETLALRNAARRLQVTTNDLLARDLFLAQDAWRSKQGLENGRQWLRLMIPINMRTAADRHMSAANSVSSVYLDRRRPDFSNPDGLLASIAEEMQLIKRLQLGYTFLFSLRACRFLPGGLEKQMRADKCTVSSILTNLGKPLSQSPLPREEGHIVAGNVKLKDMDVLAPNRPYNCAAFAVSFYAKRLSVTLHYDPRPISARQAADLLDTYARHIRNSAVSPAPSSPAARNNRA